jgi:hypothetical protein
MAKIPETRRIYCCYRKHLVYYLAPCRDSGILAKSVLWLCILYREKNRLALYSFNENYNPEKCHSD